MENFDDELSNIYAELQEINRPAQHDTHGSKTSLNHTTIDQLDKLLNKWSEASKKTKSASTNNLNVMIPSPTGSLIHQPLTENNNSLNTTSQLHNNERNKFAQVNQYKKDTVVKKLLKTINVLNEEMNKKDQLMHNYEKEITFLKRELEHRQSMHRQYFESQIEILKEEIASQKNENSSLKLTNQFMEKSLQERNKTSVNLEALANKYEHLLQENQELQNFNKILNTEIEELNRRIELIDKEKSFEAKISESFEELLQEKRDLENRNQELEKAMELMKEEYTKNMSMNEDEMSEKSKQHQAEVFELKSIISEYEQKESEFESKLKELNECVEILSQDRNKMIELVEKEKSERAQTEERLYEDKEQLEKRVDQLEQEKEQLKKNIESLNNFNVEHQEQIRSLLVTLDEKSTKYDQSASRKEEEIKRLRQTVKMNTDKLSYQQQKHENELNELRKKMSKELEQMKFANDQNTSRNGDLSKANGEMRRKIQLLETDLKEANEKYTLTKQNLDYVTKQKRELKEEYDRLVNNLRKDLADHDQMRSEYLRKNSQQQASLDQMLQQIKTFEVEMNDLITRNRELNDKLIKVNTNYDVCKRKYSYLKECMRKMLQAEEETNNESQMAHMRLRNLMRDLNMDDAASNHS